MWDMARGPYEMCLGKTMHFVSTYTSNVIPLHSYHVILAPSTASLLGERDSATVS